MRIVLGLTFSILVSAFFSGCNKGPAEPQGPVPSGALADKLRAHEFESSGMIDALTLTFSKDRYTFTYGSEGHYWHNEGRWRIDGDKAWLQAEVCKDHEKGPVIDCALSFGNGYCEFVPTPDSLYVSEVLSCKSETSTRVLTNFDDSRSTTALLSAANAKLKPGLTRTWNGIPVISMGLTEGKATTNLIVREQPRITAKEVPFRLHYYEPPAGFIPAGTTVTTIARTIEKDTVGDYENYWYLISAGATEEVWAFAEFIK